jgi:DNA-binding MarR family transcriptional regulator
MAMGKIASFFQEQKIALASQQHQRMLALDSEFDALESRVATLEAQNLELRAGVDVLKQDIERMKSQMEKSASYEGELDDIEVKILQILSSATGRVIAMSVAMHLGISQTKAEYYLTELESAGYIRGARSNTGTRLGQPPEYSLTEIGREHVLRHNLT